MPKGLEFRLDQIGVLDDADAAGEILEHRNHIIDLLGHEI
ncbi:MAG: hypothetical protein K0S56_3569, partial [Microvirga sp.]|nr:hypothetical protein [Microvirga sp.]